MFTTLLVAASAAPAAPVPADTNPAPAGPAPWVVHLKADDASQLRVIVQSQRVVKQTMNVVENVNGQQVLKQVVRDVPQMTSAVHNLAGLAGTVTAADGAPVGSAELVRRARDGVTVLISADGKAVDRAWLRAVGSNTVVVAAEALAGAVNPPQPVVNRQAVSTQAPRLMLLATGPDGTVRVTTNPAASTRYIGGRVLINNGGVVQLLDDGIGFVPGGGGPQVRPLSEVGFDAYDLTGRLVAKDEAVRRLRAGGLVLVAGDARLPDAAFLQPFRGDLLVLVSGEGLTAPGNPATTPALPGGLVRPAPAILRVAPQAIPALPAAPL
ncbi:hypothetical protein J0H58_38105, partial [bacterium]|nr:hypothetical protein [bacterium]